MPVIFDPLTGLPKRRPPRLNEPLLQPGFGPTPSIGYPPIPPTYPNQPPTGNPEFNKGTNRPIGGSWNIPDLLRQIGEDPLYRQQLSDIGASRVSDRASRTAARQRALILFGEIPEFDSALTGDVGEDITPLTRELAAKATSSGLSTVGRLEEAEVDWVRDLKSILAAKGLLSSGETGYQLGRARKEGLRAQFDARQKLLDYLGGIQAAFLQAERERQRLQADYASAAAGRIPVPQAPPEGTAPGAPGGPPVTPDVYAPLPPPPAPPYSDLPGPYPGVQAEPIGGPFPFGAGPGGISWPLWEPPGPAPLPPRIPQYSFGVGPTAPPSRRKPPFLSGYPR